jgi:hypothetical protein
VRLTRALLLALASGPAWGQSPQGVSLGPPDPIFPSDTQAPKRAGGAELLEAVCPGRVAIAEKIHCKGECPSFTTFPDFEDWELTGVTRGHFLSTSSDDAVLSMTGCEPHGENWGGTVLLTREPRGWKMLWYKAGVETSKCHKVPVENAREILVCLGSYGGQGTVVSALYVEDLLAPTLVLMASGGREFFNVLDNVSLAGSCRDLDGGPVPLRRGGIDKVEFGKNANDGLAVVVTASLGEKRPTSEEIETCESTLAKVEPRHKLDVFLGTKTYHLEFFFDGHDFKPTPEGAKAAQLLR